MENSVKSRLSNVQAGGNSMSITLITKPFTQAMVLAVTTTLCLGLSTGTVFAQEEEVIEEIHVTGSRIQRANQVQPNPVYGLSSEEIKASGQLSMIDIVDELPQLFASQNSAQSNFFATSDDTGLDNSPGLALLNLRNLGPNRTLVLVDGRRHVSGQAGAMLAARPVQPVLMLAPFRPPWLNA